MEYKGKLYQCYWLDLNITDEWPRYGGVQVWISGFQFNIYRQTANKYKLRICTAEILFFNSITLFK